MGGRYLAPYRYYSQCQSAATSEIVKRCWPWIVQCKRRYRSAQPLPCLPFWWQLLCNVRCGKRLMVTNRFKHQLVLCLASDVVYRKRKSFLDIPRCLCIAVSVNFFQSTLLKQTFTLEWISFIMEYYYFSTKTRRLRYSVSKKVKSLNIWMNEWMNEWMNVRTNGWTAE